MHSLSLSRCLCLAFLLTLLGRAPAAEQAWRFDAAHRHEDRFRPVAGSLEAGVTGGVQLSAERPESLLLDGSKTYVALADNRADADLPVKEITVEAWVQLDAVVPWGGLIGAVQDNGSVEKGWMLGVHDGQFYFALSTVGADDGNGVLTYLHSQSGYDFGLWYHVVGTYDGVEQRIHVDGRLKNRSTAQSGPILYPERFHYAIGVYHDDNELHRCPGRVAEVRVHDRAMDDEEIAARMAERAAEFPGIEPRMPEVVDWPTYLHDSLRTGFTTERLTLPLELEWTHQMPHPPQPAWPAPAEQDFWHNKSRLPARVTFDRACHPVVAGDGLYFGSSADDQVTCLDVATGRERWSFFTEGPVRLAPTVDNGRVYVGSDDGYVYCLDATDGKLLWKFRAAPGERRIPGNGRMISAWPVRTGVIIHKNKATFAAGLFPKQGTWLHQLDAITGKPISRSATTFSPQGYIQRKGNRLFASTGRAPDGPLIARLESRRKTVDGFFLGESKSEHPCSLIGADLLRFAGGEGCVAAFDAEGEAPLWQAEVDGRAYGLAVAAGRLFVSTDQGLLYSFHPTGWHAQSLGDARGESPLPSSILAQPTTPFVPRGRATNSLDTDQGYCLVLGSGDGNLVAELARRTRFQVIGIETDADQVDASRRALAEARLYGRAVIHQGQLDRLPYGDCLFNLIVTDGSSDWSRDEVRRVLRPEGGVAMLGQETMRRGPLEGAGRWDHAYANPANTASSGDRLLGTELAVQWFGRPGPRRMVDRHHRAGPPLYHSGRLFVPGNNHLFAVDAYNGTPLWETPLDDFRRIAVARDCGNMVATADLLYAIADGKCLALDSRTGDRSAKFEIPQNDRPGCDWGYLAVVDDRLFGSATRPEASRSGHCRDAILAGAYCDRRPLVTSQFLFCIDRREGKTHWIHDRNVGAIINSTLTIADGKVLLVESDDPRTLAVPDGRIPLPTLTAGGTHLVAIDAADGCVRWKTPVDLRALEHALFAGCADGVICLVGSRNQDSGRRDDKGRPILHVWYDILAVDVTTGKLLWSQSQSNQKRSGGDHGEQDLHPVLVDGTIHVEPFAYDLATGEKRDGWKLDRDGGGCGTTSASATALYFRGANPSSCPLDTCRTTKINTVSRPGCWINMIPAGGLLLIPEASSGCTCNLPLQTSMGYFPARRGRNVVSTP